VMDFQCSSTASSTVFRYVYRESQYLRTESAYQGMSSDAFHRNSLMDT
jgi:hypothetical protein